MRRESVVPKVGLQQRLLLAKALQRMRCLAETLRMVNVRVQIMDGDGGVVVDVFSAR
jgi:hypothetical protein